MVLAELVNDNSISGTALAFFTATLGAVTTVFIQNLKMKNDAREAAINAGKAQEAAEKARENTTNVSNGFASGVGRKLDYLVTEVSRIREIQDSTNEKITTHLEWHLTKEGK